MEIYLNELTSESPYELHKDLKFIKEIDQGAFGKVIHAYETKKNLDLAVKVINKSGLRTNSIEEMKEEISILKKLDHQNIVKFYGYYETNNQLLIKMEYIKYGTLSRWMKEKRKIKEEEASLILSSVLSAVEYMHSMHICHRDIKPENIMFSEKDNLSSIKIIDFGLSAQHFNYLTNNDYCGTFIYMAPEQIEKKLYHYSVDIWSIGILMFMLLNGGKHPFYQKNDKKEDFIRKIKIGKLNFINKLSFMAKHLNKKLCEVNPSWRYSANLAMKHPWITRNPNDEIPLTFNEILNRNNSKKNLSQMTMICIFLNYFKKREIKTKENNNNKEDNFFNEFILKNKKNKLYYINKKYINKCKIISEKENEKYLKRKEKCLEAVSTDEEDSIEKKQTLNSINNIKRPSLKKNSNRFNIMQKNYKEELKINKYVSDKFDKFKKKNKFNERAPKQLNVLPDSNTSINNNINIINKNDIYINSTKSLNLLSLSTNNNNINNININNKNYQIQKNDELKVINNKNNSIKNITTEKNNIENIKRKKYKSITKISLTNIGLKKDNKIKVKRVSVDCNLPYVSKTKQNNYINTTSKKYNKNNNNIRNYNIPPLVLPFIKV